MIKRIAAVAFLAVSCADASPSSRPARAPGLPASTENAVPNSRTSEPPAVASPARAPLTAVDLNAVRFEPSMNGRVGFHLKATDVSLTIGVPYTSFVRTDPETLLLQKCTNEWDKEFAVVANAIVPIESLALHVGQEEFCGGASYFDFHTRVYLVDLSPEDVLQRVREQGMRAAVALAPKAAEHVSVVPARKVANLSLGGLTLKYPRWYGDYGGTASVEVHAVSLERRTHVVMFLYARDPAHTADGKPVDPIAEILRSVRGPAPANGRMN
jgi:hypothetical protein